MPLLPVPHYQQRRQAECLTACAAMVLNYLNRPVNYETLLKRLQVGSSGASYHNLRYLESLGISVQVAQGEIDTLCRYIQRRIPPIVFVKTKELSYWQENTNHAIVVTGMDNQWIYLNDPCFGDVPKAIALTEFDLAWLEMDEVYAVLGVG